MAGLQARGRRAGASFAKNELQRPAAPMRAGHAFLAPRVFSLQRKDETYDVLGLEAQGRCSSAAKPPFLFLVAFFSFFLATKQRKGSAATAWRPALKGAHKYRPPGPGHGQRTAANRNPKERDSPSCGAHDLFLSRFLFVPGPGPVARGNLMGLQGPVIYLFLFLGASRPTLFPIFDQRSGKRVKE